MSKNEFINCKFTSVWDGGEEITTDAKVNLDTKEVIAERIDPADMDMDCDILEKEYITMTDGTTHPVRYEDDTNSTAEFWYR